MALLFHKYIRKGFSLIEVVVALAIFSLTATVLLTAIGNAVSAQEAFFDRDNRQEDRREILRHFFLLSNVNSTETELKDIYKNLDGESIEWNATIEETNIQSVFRVIFTIEWKAEEEEFTFFAFRPAWQSLFNNQESLLTDLQEKFPADRFLSM